MKKFIIIPDVTCDLCGEIREKFGVTEYIKGYINIDGEELQTTLDWTNITRDKFYKLLGNKKVTISSAVASPDEYYQVFAPYAKEGYDILSISLSSKISVTYNTAMAAAKRIMADFPDCRVECVDSLRMSGSYGLLVMYAMEMQKNGSSIDEISAWLNENRHRVHQMGPIDDMTFIARRGKVTPGKAFMGNLVGIKPMGDSNRDGFVTVLAKVKGISTALDATVAYVEELATDIENQYILISHTDREKYAYDVKARLEAKVKCKEIFISDVYGSCGTNIGPGMISVYFMGDPISEDCEKEKETLNRAIAKTK